MKKVNFITIFSVLLILFNSALLLSESAYGSHKITLKVREVQLVALDNESEISLSRQAPANIKEDSGDTNSGGHLQYISMAEKKHYRNIHVSLAEGNSVPSGAWLFLEAINIPSGCGTTLNRLTLSTTARSLITEIGSCSTGTDAGGVVLRYTFQIDDAFSFISTGNDSVTVMFTLTDAT